MLVLLLRLFTIIVSTLVGACAVAVAMLLTPKGAPGWVVLLINVGSFVLGFRAGMRIISVGLRRLRHAPPETEGPILPGQVWTYVPFNLRWGQRQDRFFVKVLRVENGAVWLSMIPGPQFQNVASPESKFRKLYRLVPDLIAREPRF
jgi:hypothetical protein